MADGMAASWSDRDSTLGDHVPDGLLADSKSSPTAVSVISLS